MKNVMLDQHTMLATWQQHTYAEFVLKDADAALATMTENPYVLRCSDELSNTALLPASSKRSPGFCRTRAICASSDGCGIFASRPNTLRPNRATT